MYQIIRVEGRRKDSGLIDKYVSCHVPKDHEDDELKDLVLRLQKHNHTQTCRKMENGRNRCRFDYPKRPSDTTYLKRNADIGNKARFYILKREVGAEMINPYNPDLLKAWKANIDIQVVGNIYGAAKYVCHYMCKDEIKQQIERKLDKLSVNCSQRQKLLKIGNTLISHRILGA
uniref:Helitron helicase-like domain-containing protein n=1 Tax=Amphimedon queenslandica TaxID=400682 RepID=A0A1X7VR33_AMPQE